MAEEMKGNGRNRSVRLTVTEWIAIGAFLISLSGIAINFGVYVNTVERNETKIEKIESRSQNMADRLIRIESSVNYLAERAAEDRRQQRWRN